ncbi:SDR family NAD(P)-dependent oxidoreductase [Labrys sp. LIt4]|uniref:SDR family NAD(P)-dependent oxidoreductase n=1 Tax=Labrys sp. LIt4 TaxID=2821355 RepID=UPI001AE05F42|nr:SDR family NAD(P)-dependent oxidoreductase [Labrys sp. LIt4]MBP0581385.1 SDR family NAD(P)-dependent oxidoreductase [Labrys sp. LIt4]
MDLELAGKVIALTGASRGVGRAIAERLAAEGAAVAIAARSAQELAEAHAVIEGHGGRCLAYACDLAVPGEAAAFVGAVIEIFGRLDGLVCNTTMAAGQGQEREARQAELALNLGHGIEALQAALPVLAPGGSVLFVVGGGDDAWPQAACRAGLAAAAARSAADHGVRINLLGRGSEALAESAAFLLSARAEGIKGALLGG